MKVLKFFILLLLVFSCTTEPDIHDFEAILTNESGDEATIHFYYIDEIVKTVVLNNSEFTTCNYSAESFDYFNRCDGNVKINAVTIIFSNGKGYNCDLSTISEQILCFGEVRSPLLNGFSDLGNNRYEFIITEEDFSNAHDLPE